LDIIILGLTKHITSQRESSM